MVTEEEGATVEEKKEEEGEIPNDTGENDEDTWVKKEEPDDEDDYLSAEEEEELPNYGESLNFPSLQKLQSAYSKDEDKEKPEFYYAYKATVKNTHDYEENRNTFSKLTLEELKGKKYNLDKLIKSANNVYEYNKKFNEIVEDSQYQREKVNDEGHGKGIGKGICKVGKGIKKGNGNDSGIGRGSGLIYYNNPQQLIDRLKLLVGSKKAGNTNPEIDN